MLLSRPVAAGGAASRSGDLQAEPPSFLSVQLPAGHWIDEIDIEARLVADEGVPAGQAQTIVAKYAGRASEATGWQIAVRQEAFALVDRAILPADEVAPPTAPAVSTPPATAAATAPSLPAVAASFTRSQSQPQLSDAVAPVKPSKPAASAAPRRRNDLPKREAASGAQEKIATITQSQPAKTSASREAARSGAMNWKLTKKGDAAENEPRGKVYKISNSRTDVSSHVTQYRVHWCNAQGEPMNKAHDLARTWETEDCLKDCQDKLEEFRIKRARAASTSQQAHQPIKAPAATTQPAAPPQTKPSEKSTPSANRLTPQA